MKLKRLPEISRRNLLASAGATTLASVLPKSLLAQSAGPAPTLIRGAAIFDGQSEELITGMDVLVEDGMISDIVANTAAPDGAVIVDADGRTLMPGLSDAHTHIMWNDNIEDLIYSAPEGYSGVLGAVNAERMLLRGFTTVRDLGGPAFGLKRAIDDGATPGPRILPTGGFISQTSGHGDFDSRMFMMSQHYTGQIDKAYLRGWTYIADGVPEVQKASREILRAGASQIKIFGSGSITGAHDPLDVTEYTLEELRAIVVEAEKWGTYATIHAYSVDSIANAIEAGVQSVEHGLFASEDLIQMMKEKDVFFSTQFFSFSVTPEQAGMTGPAIPKYLEAQAGAQNGYENAKKIGVKMAFGTDILGSLSVAPLQSQEFVARTAYYTPFEVLKQATSDNAELFERSGRRHPYQDGQLGVVKTGAYGDLLIAEGNPLEDINLVANPETGLAMVMKGGVIYKNTLG